MRRGRGLTFKSALVLRHRVMRHDLALEHPDLDTAGAVGGLRGTDAVIDIGAQRVQRHATFAVPFHARDFGAAQTTGAIDPDALRAQTHRRLNGALHGAAEGDTALKLLSDAFGN